MFGIADIDSLINSRRSEARAMRQRLALLEAEILGMEKARLALLGSKQPPKSAIAPDLSGRDKGKPKGRQPGAISHTWRRILARMHRSLIGVSSEAEIVSFAEMEGLKVREKDSQERMRHYEGLGLVLSTKDGWVVTPEAIAKFKLKEITATDTSPETKGAPE